MATDLRWGCPSRLKSPTGCSLWCKRISAMASDPVAPIVMADSTALVRADSVAFSKSRSTLMNSRVPLSPRSASSRRRKVAKHPGSSQFSSGRAKSMAPGFRLQKGQVVDGVKGGVLFAPVPRMAGDHVGAAGDRHLFDPADDAHFVVGMRSGDRVVVAIESHEGKRVGVTLGDPAGLERLGRERQHGGAVVDEALCLGADLAPDPTEQVGITGSGQVLVERRP